MSNYRAAAAEATPAAVDTGPRSPAVARAVQISLREALEHGHTRVTPTLILLSILRQAGAATQVLEQHAVNYDRARTVVITSLAVRHGARHTAHGAPDMPVAEEDPSGETKRPSPRRALWGVQFELSLHWLTTERDEARLSARAYRTLDVQGRWQGSLWGTDIERPPA